MLKAIDPGLSDSTLKHLAAQQAAIDAHGSFETRKAEMAWRWKNKLDGNGKAAFHEIFEKIAAMVVGEGYCNYCEHDRVSKTSVEHIRAKSTFPNWAFVWKNLIGACPRCNLEEKNAEMWVFSPSGSSNAVKLSRSEPLSEDLAFIDPRADDEDPMDLMELDFVDFQFKTREKHVSNARVFQKVEKTNLMLGLDDDVLARTRYRAFKDYATELDKLCKVQRATSYEDLVDAMKYPPVQKNEPFDAQKEESIAIIRGDILHRNHQTVLREMIRQANNLPPEIRDLIAESGVAEWVWP